MSKKSKTNDAAGKAACRDQRWLVFGICIFLAAITWLVFGQTIHHQFLNFDDDLYVYKNPHVSRGLTATGILWAFSHQYAANWHPLTWLSHMLDCQLYGLTPGGHHLTNVLLHMATAILLFLVLRQMTGSLWRSSFVAAVFAIHPLRVESVAWVAERKDVLSALFFVLTLAAYTRYARRPSIARYGIVLLLFALGLMCKPMLVTLPFVLLLLDYWPLDRIRRGDQIQRWVIFEKIPLLALAGISCLVTLFAQKTALWKSTDLSLLVRLGNAAQSYAAYLRQMFWPSDLAAYYPLAIRDVTLTHAILTLAVLAGISVIVFLLRCHRYLVSGWLWYLIMLVPVIGILQVGNQARADRYTYLPQIGLYLMLTWGAVDLCARWPNRKFLLGPLAGVILAALALVAHGQAAYWKDSETLWTQAIARTSDNAMAELNLGAAVYKLGRAEEALGHLQKALQLQPNEATIHGSLGNALLRTGRRQEAIAHLRASLQINPRQAAIQSSLGVALLEDGHPEESEAHLRRSLEIDPDDGDAHYNLANTLLQIGRAKEAVGEYETALRINPDDTEALNNTSWVLATSRDGSTRDGRRAVELAERADSLSHRGSPEVAATLAAAYAEAGRFADAVKTGERALQLATDQGNVARANTIRGQIQLYQSGQSIREQR